MQTDEKQKKEQLRNICVCAAAAFFVILICSRSSFLYPFNIWDDANSYFTVGKSMMRGVVPYRDLFDQKGILLYFIYGIGYLFSHTTFSGVFLMEVLSAAITVYAVFLILRLYVSEATALFLAPVTTACMYTARSFYWGGSAEEFLLPYLLCGLYLLLSYLEKTFPAPVPDHVFFFGGLCAGAVFHIKFSSVGFYIGWVMSVIAAIIICETQNRWHLFLKGAGLFLAGILLLTLPWVLYMAVHGAIDDWYRVYIYDNLFIYSKTLPAGERIYEMCKTVYHQMMANKRLSIPLILGLAAALYHAIRRRERRQWMVCMALFLTAGLLTLVIFIGGVSLPYYFFPVSTFTVTGMAQVGRLMEIIERRMRYGGRQRSVLAVAEGLICATILCYIGSANAVEIGTRQEDLVLFHMRDYIRDAGIEHPRLLNMGGFDAGLYTVTDTVPECYYFQTQTIPLPDIWETQKTYLKSGAPDFVLSWNHPLDFDTSGYRIAMEEEQVLGGNTFHFLLYERD